MPVIKDNNFGRIRTILMAAVCLLILPLLGVLMLFHAVLGSDVRALRMVVALDQCGNAALGGSEDETISSRSWYAYQDGKKWGRLAVGFIDAILGKDHCKNSAGY